MNRRDMLRYGLPAAAALFALTLLLVTGVFMSGKPAKIRKLHRELSELQSRLISAEITSQRLEHVQRLIDHNLAYSARDSLAQGASLSFLKDLTQVLDKLKITLVSLEPEKPSEKPDCIVTPYKIELLSTYPQFLDLLNKMEKSPRLISLSEFEIKNDVDEYFSDDKEVLDQCRIVLKLTTLTLVRSRP